MLSMVLLLYHWWGVLRNVREERQSLAPFVAPFLLLMPEMFTEKGKYHRRWVLRYIVCVVISVTVGILIDSYRRGLILGGP
jgi:uncharacterized membrane protein YkgB